MASSKFLRQLGRKELLTPHVDRWFERMQPKLGEFPLHMSLVKEDDPFFHPSSHVVGCARTIFKAFDPIFAEENSRRTFNNKVATNGHLWHALLEHVMVNELGFAQASEVSLYAMRQGESVTVTDNPKEVMDAEKLWVAKGTVDLPHVTPPGSTEQYVVDIKTMNPESFIAGRPSEYLWRKYVGQMQLYMDWTDTDKGIFFCVKAANPFDFKEIVIERDRDHVKYIYEKWDVIARAIAANKPPEHTCAEVASCPSNQWYDLTQASAGD